MSALMGSVQDNDQEKQPRVDGKPVVSANVHAVVLRQESYHLTSKEHLSGYFTISAAAFGLVSDGCRSPLIIPFGSS